jgi:hypothetical protein
VTTLLTDAVRSWIGRRVTYHAPEVLGRASIRVFAIAIGADPTRWVEEAPPTLICETNQITGKTEADSNAFLGHRWELPLPVDCEMIRGGNDYQFGRLARHDDVITTEVELVDAVERRAKDQSPLLFVTSRQIYHADDGSWLATNTETLIFRPRVSP